MKTRIAIIFCFLAGLALVGGVAAFRSSGLREKVAPSVIRPAVVRCAPLQERPYSVTESFHGLIQANIRIDMAFQIAGRLAQLGSSKDKTIKEMDSVEPGQVLAQLEPLRYEAALQEAKAREQEAKAAQDAANAQIADAKARAEDAAQELGRLKKMGAAGAANTYEIDKAQTAVKVANAQLDAALAKLAAATAVYQSARATGNVANINLDDATLKSPIRGLVAAVPVDVGQMVSPSQPIITLVDLSKVKLVVGVVERKLPLLKKDQKVQVEVQALASDVDAAKALKGDTTMREGTIAIVPPAADPATGLFNVEIELANADGRLRPGMIGKAVVCVSEKKAIAIPAEAASRVGDQYYAFFIGDGYQTGLNLGQLGQSSINVPMTVAHRVAFKPVMVDRDFYLLADLPQGFDRLIVEGQTRLTDGQTVRIIEPMAAGESNR
ncbi:MAG: efflux RND transporter periplasmic adaptor subunit [Phycisphaeraceae bacterium]|nr:efflux RND transporter periplasmic adaptor subunit [Phycisphaeraceae bacterium]